MINEASRSVAESALKSVNKSHMCSCHVGNAGFYLFLFSFLDEIHGTNERTLPIGMHNYSTQF